MQVLFEVFIARHRGSRIAILTIALLATGCSAQSPAPRHPVLQLKVEPFKVYWPPVDPDVKPASARLPLLTGELAVAPESSVGGSSALRASITIVRPSSEVDRSYWNKSLAFADIAWMSEVRVWDVDHQWLWPNLPYMLRLPGKERLERYGGVDPGKHVDNDFAAVLIRKFDAAGAVESPETKDSPLVSAEWHPVDAPRGDPRSIRHAARSDEFVVHLGGPSEASRGRLKIWLIYADFLGHPAPASWPRTPEYAGGILAYFEIDWDTTDGTLRAAVRHLKPTTATGFNWATWARHAPGEEAATAEVRLSNR